MTELADMLGPELVAAIAKLVDERVEQALAVREPASSPWLSVQEAAGYLGVSARAVQRLVERDRVRSATLGRRRLFRRDDLDAFLNAATGEDVAPTTPPRRRRRSVDPAGSRSYSE